MMTINPLLQIKQDLAAAASEVGINKTVLDFVSYAVKDLEIDDYPVLIANPPRSRNPQRERFKYFDFTVYLLTLNNSDGLPFSETERISAWGELESKWNEIKEKMTPPRYIFIGDDTIGYDDNLIASGDLFIEVKTTIRVSKCTGQ